MTLVELAREAFPEAWAPQSPLDRRVVALTATVVVLNALKRNHANSQVGAVVDQIMEER